jgi:chromosome segregation ATPase
MELQQIENRLDWLDDERRKDKNTINQLRDRIITLEGKLKAAEQENKSLDSELTRLKAVLGRLDRIDEALASNRTEFGQWVSQEKQRSEQRESEVKKLLRLEVQGVESNLNEAQKLTKSIPTMHENLEAREQEEKRLSGLIDNINQALDEMRLQSEDQSRLYRVLDDGHTQDTQRLTDLQGEVSALRKRSDEFRGRFEVSDAEFRRVESRLKELVAVEQERTESQTAFFKKQTAAEADREKTWKDWTTRFDTIEVQATEIEEHIQSLGEMLGDVKRTNQESEELNQKVERRIAELTEMQRLTEERFRQEWNSFKADDQKRWTNYMLSHDEQQSDSNRRLERMAERVTLLEDGLQEFQDLLGEMSEFSWKHLQVILEAVRDWTGDHERLQGGLR